jgi:hypothetical protein
MYSTRTDVAEKKHNCEVKDVIYCRNKNVRRFTGTEKSDPKFWCCWSCEIMLRGQGVKPKEVK